VWLAAARGRIRKVGCSVVLGYRLCAAVEVYIVKHTLGGSVVVGEYGVWEVVMFLLKSLGVGCTA
jgi:hypothetical protein